MQRRSFFKKLAAAVAIVALAPEIAFRREIKTEFRYQQFWYQETCMARCFSQEYIDFMCAVNAGYIASFYGDRPQ